MSSTPRVSSPAITKWNIDPVHSAAEFRVKHMMISSIRGQFTGVTGTLTYDESDVYMSSIEANIDVETVNTHNPQRDAHLKSPDFLDVEKFPTLTFHSTRVTRRSDGRVAVAGPLTIHGITREAEFAVEGPTPPAKDPWGNTRIGATAATRINRTDYGLNFNATLETGGILVGEDVNITLELELVKA